MIKKNLKTLIVTSIVILLPMFAGVAVWNKLPDRIPTHWNFEGEIDGWSSKSFAVFALPCIMLAFQWVAVLATSADPKKNNHSDKVLSFVFWVIPAVEIVMMAAVYCAAMGKPIEIDMVMSVLIGVMFVVIGNYLPKCKQNYTIGIKVPWTLNSEENWNRTHRMAGWVWVAGGILTTLGGLLSFGWIAFAVSLIIALLPIVYSYILHVKGI